MLTLSADRRQLVMSGVKRSFKQAVAHVSKELTAHGAGEGWRIYVTHAAVPEMAQVAPFGIPPLPRIRVRAQGGEPTGASQGRAATGWFLRLLVRGLAALHGTPCAQVNKKHLPAMHSREVLDVTG